jgi:glycosyltransferase involved in cell wall biosynthesis
MAFWLEKKAYNKADGGFYVGGLNRTFNIPREKYVIIQNGIDQTFADKFKNRINKAIGKINITFIGQPMDHHRLDVLVDAFKLIKQPASFRMHFIGPGLEYLKERIPSAIETRFYGKRPHEEIELMIGEYNIGVIMFAYDYFSHVKLFMYGAAKLLVILPETLNFVNIFTNKEVIFIQNGNAADLALKLDVISERPSMLQEYGDNLYKKVIPQFTWERIYYEVADSLMKSIKN